MSAPHAAVDGPERPHVGARFRRPPTAQVAVLEELRRSIASGRLRPGEQILQDALAVELGVSRVPLREALKVLEAEGQVTYIPHRGYSITQLSLPDLLEVNRLREVLEAEAVRVAVPQLTVEDIERLAGIERELEQACDGDDIVALCRINHRFHFALFERAGRPRLERLLRVLWDATDVYRTIYLQSSEQRVHVIDDHRQIIHALSRGDADGVIALLDRHRDNSVAAIRDMLDRRRA